MFFIATGSGWWPSLNPFGLWSATAALLSAIAWFLADYRLSRANVLMAG
jgi:hypothetical protein